MANRRSIRLRRGTRRTGKVSRWARGVMSKYASKRRSMRRGNASVTRVRTIGGLSDRMMVRLPYEDFFTATSANCYVQYRLNSLYAPLSNSAGTTIGPGNLQPAGFDRLSTAYASYRVVGCKCEVWIAPYGSATALPVRLSIYPTDSVTLPNTADAEGVIPRNWIKVIGQGNTSGRSLYYKRYFSTAAITGKTKDQVWSSDDYVSVVSANPADLTYLVIKSLVLDDVTAQTLAFRVRLTYYASMEDPLFDRTDD